MSFSRASSMYSTNSFKPSFEKKVSDLKEPSSRTTRLSVNVRVMPAFRNASSFRRFERISYLKTVSVKMELSGKKVVFVPVLSILPITCTSCLGIPQAYSCICNLPSRATSTRVNDDKALTQETPTPCNPPETL